jgi:hypothetical protein
MAQSRAATEFGIKDTAEANLSLAMAIDSSNEVEGQILLMATAATRQTAASREFFESVSYLTA